MEFLQYDFMQRALLAGAITAIVCPLIGIFVVVKRQSMIGDGLGHLAFAGIAAGYLLRIYPLFMAVGATVAGSVLIEYIRRKHSSFADMGLAIVFYFGMALAIIFSTMSHMPGAGLSAILFGSLMTVSMNDLLIMCLCSIFAIVGVGCFFDKLFFMALDEEAANVAGIAVDKINLFFSIITAIVVTISMLSVGILLAGAMMIVPVAIAHVFKKGFRMTLCYSLFFSLLSVITGIIIAFYANMATGGTIVLVLVGLYLFAHLFQSVKKLSQL